jgi:hypothetical protein
MHLILCALLLTASVPVPHGGSFTTWTGAFDSDWSVGMNWTNGIPNVFTSVIIPPGTPNQASTSGFTGAICQDITVQAGATLNIALGSPLEVLQAANIHGSIVGGGLLRFVDSTLVTPHHAGSLGGAGLIGAHVEIAKNATNFVTVTSHLTLELDLIVSSGTFQPSVAALVTVFGNGQFQGGTLSAASSGAIFDFAGGVTFSGTSATGVLPTIRCAGNWSSNAGFSPQGCHVIFDGAGPQSVSASGAFDMLTVEPGSTVSATSSLTVNWTLQINGALAVAPHALDANGQVTVGVGGSLGLGGGSHTFASSFVVNGSLAATGTLVFDGSSMNAAIISAAPLPSLQIAKGGSASLQVNSDLTLNGNLTHTSGTFVVAFAQYTVAVSGNAQFLGGTLTVGSVGAILDVAGNVTFAGTTASAHLPTIRCGGNWSANAGYAPSNALVVFDGTASQSISGAGFFDDVTVQAGSSVSTTATLNLGGPLVVNGTLTVAPHSLDVNGPLTVASTGTLNLGGGSHAFGDAFTVTGTLSATGTLVFDESSVQIAISSTAALPSVTIAKTGGSVARIAGNLAINGNLTQTSGVFQVAQGNTTVSVAGNAHFQGGTLQTWAVGTLDVAGNVTFSGTDATGGVPIIKCGGNWTSDANYSPSLGIAILDGSGPQTISGAGQFDDLTIFPGATVTSNTSLTIGGPLIVNGSLSLPSQTLHAQNALNVPAGGALHLGGGTHEFAGDFTANGTLTATGTLVFNGNVALTQIIAAAPLPNVQISKGANAFAAVASNLTVNGNLTLISGIFRVSQATQTVSVSGNALFQGGELTAFGVGILDVAGNVTFSGTTANGPAPTIRCAGNWTSNAAFAPSSCTVELDGTSPTTLSHSGAILSLTALSVKNGPRTVLTDFLVAANAISVDANAALVIGAGRHLRVHHAGIATAFAVNGGLSLSANGRLSLGPNAALAVAAGGSLSLAGAPAQPATIAGEAGGGYALTVSGALSAKNFVVKEMGNAGMVVNSSAVIAAAPNDFRGGAFDFRAGAGAGSVLLDLRRSSPAVFRYLTFLNTPGVAGVFNVKTTATSAPFGFTNWTGAFSGPSFENDPLSQIAWNPPEASVLAQFSVQPGAELAEVTWRTSAEVDLAGFEIQRATSQAGPFTTVFTTPVLGPIGWQYGIADAPLAANQIYFYTLYAKLTHDALVVLASGSTTPYGSGPPANVKKVGGDGTYSTIQAAINAATDPNSVVWVTPGTYPSFTIGAAAVPSNLRILADDAGPVLIDTSAGPIRIMNVPAASGVELSNLIVGSPGTAQDGIVVTNCACPIVLDEIDVSCDAGHVAVSVSNAPATAIQRSVIQGGTGLQVSSGSYVAISRGSLSSLVSTGSTIEISTLTPGSVNVTPAGSLVTRAGMMPEIDLPELVRISAPSALFLHAAPNAPFTIMASPRLGFQTGSYYEMPFLLDVSGTVQLPLEMTDWQGFAAKGFEVRPAPVVFGFAFTVQVVVADPVTGALQLSNVESMCCVP